MIQYWLPSSASRVQPVDKFAMAGMKRYCNSVSESSKYFGGKFSIVSSNSRSHLLQKLVRDFSIATISVEYQRDHIGFVHLIVFQVSFILILNAGLSRMQWSNMVLAAPK